MVSSSAEEWETLQTRLARRRTPRRWTSVGLALSIVAGGLAPFAARTHPVPFLWVPFQGFLGGSMYVNVQSALEKSFLYGALVLAVWRLIMIKYHTQAVTLCTRQRCFILLILGYGENFIKTLSNCDKS